MSAPTPDPRSTGKLVWASDEVMARIEVKPQASLGRRIAVAATLGPVFTWLPAFVVFAAVGAVAPSVTGGASVGRTAFWALQFAVLMAISAIVTILIRPAAEPEAPDTDPSTRRTLLRLATSGLLTGVCAWVVLALHGLSTGQIAPLVAVLIAVLHGLPVIVAKLLQRIGDRRQTSSA